jgi:hypothetical protein
MGSAAHIRMRATGTYHLTLPLDTVAWTRSASVIERAFDPTAG